MNTMERLNEAIMKKGPLLAGLDPDLDKLLELSKEIDSNLDAWPFMEEYCFNYIEAVKENVAAIKINIAFFEAYGMLELFWTCAKRAKKEGLFVIADVKRADIGNTSKQYAKAFLQHDLPIDAITINPYFGTDGVKPFLEMAKENDKGIFVLLKTSNPSSEEIQNIVTADGEKVYQKVAKLVDEWGEYTKCSENEKYSLVGAVVGAAHPAEAEELRRRLPNTFFLVPGYGAQGATADDIVVNFDNEGGGAVVNSSRGLMFAYKGKVWNGKYTPYEWANATKAEAKRAQKELVEAIKKNS